MARRALWIALVAGLVALGLTPAVNAAATPPVITTAPQATPNPANAGAAVSFSVAATDPDGGTLTYNWYFGDNTSGTGSTTTHVYSAAGNYTATARIATSEGGLIYSNVTVTVNAAPVVNPVITTAAQATPNPADVGATVSFSVAATDPSGGDLTYNWFFGDNTSATGSTATHSYSAAGTYNAAVRVGNAQGGRVYSNVTVTVTAASVVNPVITTAAQATPNPVAAGANVNFSVTATDPSGGDLTYNWFFGDNTSATGSTVVHSYATAGSYNAAVRVGNAQGGRVYSTVTVTVTAAAADTPVITSPAQATPNPADTGADVTFSVAATDPAGNALNYIWYFGDGTSGTGSSAVHSYATAGSYTATVRVGNDQGGRVYSSVTVIVNDPPTTASPDMLVLKMLGYVKFNATNSDSVSLYGALLNLSGPMALNGAVVTLNVGGAQVSFTLDAAGRAKSSLGTFALRFLHAKRDKTTGTYDPQGNPVIFYANLTHGSWATAWAADGIDPTVTTTNASLTMPVSLTLGGSTCTTSVPVNYYGKANVIGRFRK